MVPLVIGVIGVGTISSACVRGLCGAPGLASQPRFVLSPRNAARAAQLRDEFPDSVTIVDSNQAVLDACDAVLLAVLPGQCDDVLGPLAFREEHLVISLMAGVDLARVEKLTAPAKRRCVAMPLPVVARRAGVTLVVPAEPTALELFGALGRAVGVADEAQFRRLQAMTCVMGDTYARLEACQDWLTMHGVDAAAASSYVGGLAHSITLDSSDAEPETFAKLVAEQTPGGMNQMVVGEQRDAGAYQALQHSLDSVHSRLAGAHDASLAPATRRTAESSGGHSKNE
ncbi:hypothetical protein M885DRAFT_508664 [Pelagophyceae sp. CCMP2097]|nr:hypothetical protein M885DRAFT_508664 [Pelagophyceae sp. CCMP2097]|mmetsp:Transcript_903/g.3221  ORF Transcript_903/g.3221 Transcript_903/m.3221 type:complete len:285 (-) Transcript_903:105-959(-)